MSIHAALSFIGSGSRRSRLERRRQRTEHGHNFIKKPLFLDILLLLGHKLPVHHLIKINLNGTIGFPNFLIYQIRILINLLFFLLPIHNFVPTLRLYLLLHFLYIPAQLLVKLIQCCQWVKLDVYFKLFLFFLVS